MANKNISNVNTQKLWLFGLIPIIAGFLNSYVFVSLPVIGGLLFAILPWAMTVLWIWIGYQIGKSGHRLLPSLVITHLPTFLCVICAVWQAGFVSAENRNPFFFTLAQLPFDLVPGVVQLTLPFATHENVVMGTKMISLGVPMTGAALLLLFSIGFYLGRHKEHTA